MIGDGPSQPEMRLLRRLRTLHNGVHLCIIQIDASGVYSVSIVGSGKAEKVRRLTDEIGRGEPADGLQEHS